MKSVLAVCVSALSLAVASAGLAQSFPTPDQILPPAPAWKGRSERLIARPNDPWITPAERSGLTATPTYAETRAFIDRMDAASPLIRQQVFGRTAQGRELVAVIVSKDGERPDPSKPVLLAQAGIHSGEIDGKDAGLMLVRDIAFRGKDALLDRVNLVFVPIFNADGHERSGPYNRPNQRGPVAQGWRTTAQNLNLNRDYVKADSPEMRAMLGLLRSVDPTLYLDLHVTDGADYAYDVTYGYEGWDGRYGRSTRIAAWLESTLRPALDAGLTRQGHVPGPLVFAADDQDPAKGVAHFAGTPRFSTGYGDLTRIPTVLVENHSLKPYRQRVLGAYVLLEESLKALATGGAALKAAVAADRAERPAEVASGWRPSEQPVDTWRFRTIANERRVSPITGREEVIWLGREGPTVDAPVFGQTPGATLPRPSAYWVPVTKPEVIERLRAHGIAFETLTEPRTVSVTLLRVEGPRLASSVNEGRVGVTIQGVGEVVREETFPAGSVRVPTDQPLGDLAVVMLDPRSPDGLFAWGFFPEILQRTEYVEAYFMAPLAERMLRDDPALKAAYEAKLASDPAFAADADARLAWFYERTPYYDARFRLYPVGLER